MNAQVRLGYKQTDVGVIPEDWAVEPLINVSAKIMVGIASSATHAYRREGIPLLRNQNIKAGHLDDADILYVDPEYESTFKNKRLEEGDLLIARTGYPGTTCVVPSKYESAQSFTTLIVRPDKSKVDSNYLCYYLNSEYGQNFFELSQIGGAQKNVNAGSLKAMPIPVQLLPEQRAIAAALSDMDLLINCLDQLIAKKRDIKQAAMQQLLSGQQRLPGFSGQWKVKQFFDVLSRVNGKNNQIQTTDYKIYGAFPVVDQGKDHVAAYSDESDKVYSCPSDGVIVFGDHTCIIKYIDFDFIVGADGTQIIRAKHGECTRFLAYKLELSGITSTGYNRHFKFLKELEFLMPPMEEQAAIATILSDMDSEFANLETRRVKARQLKRGMIQELLTGRIRLSQISQEAKLC